MPRGVEPGSTGSVDNPEPRRAARILLVDSAERVLLFHGYDPARPSHGYWFTPGGGLDPGESSAEGAARELREETGLAVGVHEMGQPVWHETTTFPFDGWWYQQEQDFFLLRVDSWHVSVEGFDAVEQGSIDAHRWWSVAELETTEDRFYPVQLPSLLRAILNGDALEREAPG